MSNGNMMSGGRSAFKYSPVRQDGVTRKFDNIDGSVNMIGVHTGDYAGLNVINPRPGWYYQYCKSTPTARMIESQKGGQVVADGDDDHPAYMDGIVEDESDTPTLLDTARVYGDVVLMRYPEKVIAARRQREEADSLQAISQADQDFLTGASPGELAAMQGQLTRFALRRHNLAVKDESGVVTQQWTPARGILETD